MLSVNFICLQLWTWTWTLSTFTLLPSFTGKKNCIFSEKKSIHNDSLNIYDQVKLNLYLELDPLPSTSPLDLSIVLSPLTISLHLCLDLNTSTLLPSLTIVGYYFEFLLLDLLQNSFLCVARMSAS